MRVLFCSDPLRPAAVDPDWAAERAAAEAAGLDAGLVDHDAVRAREWAGALRRAGGPGAALYRGWMLTAAEYADLHAALAGRGIDLVTSPDAYVAAHHLPAAPTAVRDRGPGTVWFAQAPRAPLDTRALRAALDAVGPGAAVIKDWVKSRKHEWDEACFIPDTTDPWRAEAVARRFLDLQGDDLTGGIVVRRFVALEQVGRHPRSGMPLAREWRTFWSRHGLLTADPYSPEVPPEPAPPLDELAAVAASVPSPFFTMDVARTVAGGWLVIELGDGQVSGLPPGRDPAAFYQRVAAVKP